MKAIALAKCMRKVMCSRHITLIGTGLKCISTLIGEGPNSSQLPCAMEYLPAEKHNVSRLLRAHAKAGALHDGRLAHAYIVASNLDQDIFIVNCLLQMYGSCGCPKDAQSIFLASPYVNVYSCNIMINVYVQNELIVDAWKLFASMASRDVVTWNAMVTACVRRQEHQEALSLFRSMPFDGVVHNATSFAGALDARSDDNNVSSGYWIHTLSIFVGLEEEIIVRNALINFYGKHGNVNDARHVFSQIACPDIISWTSMLSAYGQNGYVQEALNTFYFMQYKGIKTDKVAHICALDACADIATLEDGQLIHSAIFEDATEKDVVVSSALVNMYGHCLNVEDAKNVFLRMPIRNVVSWTSMLSVYSQNGNGEAGLELFQKMQLDRINPNAITLAFAIDACTNLMDVEEGQEIHRVVVKRGLENDTAIATCLVKLYGKFGYVTDAKNVFMKLQHKNMISWSTMISAYTQNGLPKEAIWVFHEMQANGLQPNNITCLCLIDACCNLLALDYGRAIAKSIVEFGLLKDVMLGNALMNMYGKCGSWEDAELVFNRMHSRNIVSWTAVIAAFSQCGHGRHAVAYFNRMLCQGILPDGITFTCLLNACSHSGLVDDGVHVFVSMFKHFGILQITDHFVCIVDLLGRAGLLYEAQVFIEYIPSQDLYLPWLTLLGACRSHGDPDIGSRAANCCFEQDPYNSTPYTFLGNVLVTLERDLYY